VSKEQVAAEIQQLIVLQVETINRALIGPERLAYRERNQRIRELFTVLAESSVRTQSATAEDMVLGLSPS
jgi:hypothetical protein